MGKRILVPVDGSSPARSAVEYACEQFHDGSIVLMYVMNPLADLSRNQAFPGYSQDDEFRNEREKAEYVLESLRDEIPDTVSVETEVWAGDPARTILQYTDNNDVDQIVIGSHGRKGAARVLLGSVAETVIRRSRVPVTVVRSRT